MIIKSVFDDEQTLLQSIIKLHVPMGIELDPMYYKGNFYKTIERPKYIYDINPIKPECGEGDARHLPFEDGVIKSMILDPPFLFEIRKRRNKNYSVNTHGILYGFSGLEDLYRAILSEAYRILMPKSKLIFKCQDFTDSETTMTHCYVWQWAIEIGFYPKDLAILNLPKNKVYNGKLTQRHLRKVHSYFWIFQKCQS